MKQRDFDYRSPPPSPLFDHQPYGGNPPSVDQPTSRAAAESVAPTAASKRGQIYALICDATNGVTDDELEITTGWRHQTVSARRRELVLGGHVRDTKKTRNTTSGRKAIVWEAVRA